MTAWARTAEALTPVEFGLDADINTRRWPKGFEVLYSFMKYIQYTIVKMSTQTVTYDSLNVYNVLQYN